MVNPLLSPAEYRFEVRSRRGIKMLRKSKMWRISAISLFTISFGLTPALAVDCGSNGYSTGYVVQQGYPAVLARYCDGYGGGQWPYGCCSIGQADYIAPLLVPTSAGLPIVTKYRADADHVTRKHLAKSKPLGIVSSTKSAKQRRDSTSASAGNQDLHL